MAMAAPVALSTVKRRYLHLYKEFTILSDREKEASVDFGSVCSDNTSPSSSAIDSETGLCTTISFNDFTEPLEDNGNDCPMKTESDANKFCVFLWKCLLASLLCGCNKKVSNIVWKTGGKFI